MSPIAPLHHTSFSSLPYHRPSLSVLSLLLTYFHSCAADRYGLDELKRLALRKQGLQSGIQISTILASARWAYTHTPDSDSKLRAHYLALIIRSRNTFKRSGTMQMEMEEGGKLFFDLFVAMCNHMVSYSLMSDSSTLLRPQSSTPLLVTFRRDCCLSSCRAFLMSYMSLTISRMILPRCPDHRSLVSLPARLFTRLCFLE